MTDRCYGRISLDRVDTSGSINRQANALHEKVVGDYVDYFDRSVSGSVPFRKRPEGARLLADMRRGDRFLVTKIDRMARDLKDLLWLVATLDKAGVELVVVEQAGLSGSGMGKFMLMILGAVAEFERDLIRERRTESAKAFRLDKRHSSGRPPYGLRAVPNPAGRGLVLRPDPVQAPLLRDAVAAVMAGESARKVAAGLGLSPGNFSKLLRNERLAGIIPPPRVRDANGRDTKEPVPGVAALEDPDMAVFTMTEWADIQDWVNRKGTKTWTPNGGYGAALACEACGGRLYKVPHARSDGYQYHCRRVDPVHTIDKAPAGSISVARADGYLERQFLTMFGSLPVMEVVQDSDDTAKREAIARATHHLHAITEAIAHADLEDMDRVTELQAEQLAAMRALKEAQAMDVASVRIERPTGETYADVWHRATDTERADLLTRFGPWTVRPGRMKNWEERLSWTPTDAALRDTATALAPDYLAGQTDEVAVEWDATA
ncbi:recombinase family protein [Nocardioides ochotonae]|uniref:recombinase family protein n=1 Tax=Nocardioides ochotonae TaxID=2685869 RepID=UPI00174A8AFF|nr:recombinase family protein [Nocardioides ochotonae]